MVLAGGVVTLVAVHTAAWLTAVHWLEAGLPTILAEAKASGWTVGVGQEGRTGWPIAATLRLTGVTASHALGNSVFRWAAEQVDVTLTPTDPAALRISTQGDQSIAAAPATPLLYHTDLARLRIPFTAAESAFEVRALTLKAGRWVRAGLVTGQVSPTQAAVSATDVTVSRPFGAPFDAGARVSATVSVSPAFPASSPTPAVVAAWQSANGRVTLPSFDLHWGPVHATASGTGQLDSQLQPAAQAVLNVEGASALLDAAVREGVVTTGGASAVGAVIGLLTLAAGGGPIGVPVNLADRTLRVAQFPLAKLPVIDWAQR